MRLYLARHGEAEAGGEDSERRLTGQGRREAADSARTAARLGARPSRILHSGRARARETAEILGAELAAPVEPSAGLSPCDPVEPWVDRLEGAPRDLMLVGHLPFMGSLASALLAGDADRDLVSFRTAALACLDQQAGRWRLLWIVWPEMG